MKTNRGEPVVTLRYRLGTTPHVYVYSFRAGGVGLNELMEHFITRGAWFEVLGYDYGIESYACEMKEREAHAWLGERFDGDL